MVNEVSIASGARMAEYLRFGEEGRVVIDRRSHVLAGVANPPLFVRRTNFVPTDEVDVLVLRSGPVRWRRHTG